MTGAPAPKEAGIAADAGIRRAEIIAALSLATDLSLGQPMENALRSCVLAMRLGEALNLSDDELNEVYWTALLRHVGCNADSHTVAAIFGDEVAFNREATAIDVGRAAEMLPLLFGVLRKANDDAPPLERFVAVMRGLMGSKALATEVIGGHCEVAERLADRLGFGPAIVRDIGQSEERWDGRGLPRGLSGEAIPPAVRVVNFARDVVVLTAAVGEDAASAKLRQRRKGAYDPRVVDRYFKRAGEFTAGFSDLVSWNEVLRLEPGPPVVLSEEEFDRACLAMADFADLKSPYSNGHSRAVATLAGAAGGHCGLPRLDVADLVRAGMLHDIGNSGISARIWSKPGPLTDREWEEVRLHPYYGERVLARPASLARLAAIVGAHHERLDGSGYYRGTRSTGLSPQAKILAVAEAYQGMIEDRPHRKAMSADQASVEIKREARAGRLDAEAAAAVLAAAGHKARPVRRELVAGLTERELDVLRLVARGKSMKEIGRALGISPKTVDNHLQHVYPKIAVRTRAGATLFAIEHGLTGASESG